MRRLIQFQIYQDVMYGLDDRGVMWARATGMDWEKLGPLPPETDLEVCETEEAIESSPTKGAGRWDF